MTLLHNEVTAVIQRYQQDHGELPEGMRSLYDYLHGRQIERTAQVRRMQDIYRGT